MKKLILPGAMILLLALVGCGKIAATSTTTTTSGGGNEVTMASVDFVQHSISVKAGDTVKFVDPSGTGNLHILCFGQNEQCKSNPDGPAELNASSGVQFNAGDPPKSFTFTKAGTYEVTCTIHQNMNVTITVA
ncbi:MAG: hypothetical protein PVSMB4_05780 [Ktedonobacterales bacterium]